MQWWLSKAFLILLTERNYRICWVASLAASQTLLMLKHIKKSGLNSDYVFFLLWAYIKPENAHMKNA